MYGWTPLYTACSSGRVECAQLLLDRGARVDVPNVSLSLADWLLLGGVHTAARLGVRECYGCRNVAGGVEVGLRCVASGEWWYSLPSCSNRLWVVHDLRV
jgi:hypothetical protein